MKWTLAISLLTSAAVATPVPAPDGDTYRLRVTSVERNLNKQVLTVHNGKVGIFKSVKAPELAVYSAPAARSDLVILHALPSGTNDDVLALVGENNVFTLSTVENPQSRGLRPNGTMDWTFSMDRRAPPAVSGSRDTSKDLLYTARSGSWIAYPDGTGGDFVMKFWADADKSKGEEGSYIPQIQMPAQIVYERIQS